jgi:hypothetical protein
MAQGGWNTTGALLLCAAFILCLVSPTINYSSTGGSFAFNGTFQGMLLPVFGIAISWFGVRDGQRWAWWTVLLGLLVIAILRISTDRACTVRIFSQHGCHQFMLGVVVGAAGLVLSRE